MLWRAGVQIGSCFLAYGARPPRLSSKHTSQMLVLETSRELRNGAGRQGADAPTEVGRLMG